MKLGKILNVKRKLKPSKYANYLKIAHNQHCSTK